MGQRAKTSGDLIRLGRHYTGRGGRVRVVGPCLHWGQLVCKTAADWRGIRTCNTSSCSGWRDVPTGGLLERNKRNYRSADAPQRSINLTSADQWGCVGLVSGMVSRQSISSDGSAECDNPSDRSKGSDQWDIDTAFF